MAPGSRGSLCPAVSVPGPSGWPGVDLGLMGPAGLSSGPMLNVLGWGLGAFEGKSHLALTSFI